MLATRRSTCTISDDDWRHVIELEELKPPQESDGALQVLDGAMRCPAEDSEGSDKYQNDILDRYNAVVANPNDRMKARALADACHDAYAINAINVRGSFLPTEFSVESCQTRVKEVCALEILLATPSQYFVGLKIAAFWKLLAWVNDSSLAS